MSFMFFVISLNSKRRRPVDVQILHGALSRPRPAPGLYGPLLTALPGMIFVDAVWVRSQILRLLKSRELSKFFNKAEHHYRGL